MPDPHLSDPNLSDPARRNLLIALASLAAGSACLPAQTPAQTPTPADPGSLGQARVFSPEGNLKKLPNGGERWAVLAGTLATGELVAIHESVLPTGAPAPPVHRNLHSELIVVHEGTLNFEHNGLTDHAPAGSVLYVPFGTNHALGNAGPGPARYFVLQIGGDTHQP